MRPQEATSANDLINYLKKQVDDPESYVKDVRGKKLKEQFRKIVRHMQAGDQLWEYHWSEERGPRFCYGYGWCIVRNGVVVEDELIHTS
jgi:hypothetical protein